MCVVTCHLAAASAAALPPPAACTDHGEGKLRAESTLLDRRRPAAAYGRHSHCRGYERWLLRTWTCLNALGTSKVWASHSPGLSQPIPVLRRALRCRGATEIAKMKAPALSYPVVCMRGQHGQHVSSVLATLRKDMSGGAPGAADRGTQPGKPYPSRWASWVHTLRIPEGLRSSLSCLAAASRL